LALAIPVAAALPEVSVDPALFAHYEDSVAILDRGGTPLRQARSGAFDRRWVPLSAISRDFIDAVIAVEDARFWEHDGIDERALVRACVYDLLPGRRWQGGSTITQQLVKLVYGRPWGLASKGLEMLRALKLEQTFSKEEILEQYLNRLPFGNGIVGVERAAQAYFGHSAAELTLAEAALLAGIPQAPSATEPRRHLPRARKRQALVLARMRALGLRSEEAIAAAERQEVRIVAAPPRPWRAPRFVDAVLRERAQGHIVACDGRIVTSLDLPLQERAEALLRERLAALEGSGATNAAAIVVANASGEILAYVGAARADPDEPGGELDLLRARRQPGSTLKPFVYELLFEHGGTAATVLDDIATPMTGRGGTIYAPRDFDGQEWGPVRARVALAASLNLAALDAARRVGPEAIVARLGVLGIRDLPPPEELGPAVVLGGADVRPIELAEAYVALARGGRRVPLRLVPGMASEGERVMDPGAVAIVRDVLSDRAARELAFGSDLREEAEGLDFALKTGTSSGFRDAWAVVFDERFTVLVWIGDPAGRPMARVSGFHGAAPVAAQLLVAAHRRAPALGPAASAWVGDRPPLVRVRVCAHTGLLPGPRCRHLVDERFLAGTVPSRSCEDHDDEGAVLLPHRYADWVARVHPAGMRLREVSDAGPDADVRVVYPAHGARLIVDPARGETRIPLRAAIAGATATDVAWEIDGRPWSEPTWPLRRGEHRIVAIWRGRRSAEVRFSVE
jgi:penicillin-binding protein 1C